MIYQNFKTSTAYIINDKNLTETMKINLKSKLSTLGFRDQKEIPKAYFEYSDGENNYVMIPRIDLSVLNWITKAPLTYIPMYTDDFKLPEGTYNLTDPPFDYQEPILKDAKEAFDYSDDRRVCITLLPGYGKTYIASNLINYTRTKFLCLVYSSELAKQNRNNMEKMLKCKGLYFLDKGKDFVELNYDKINGLFMTFAMFKSCLDNYGMEKVIDIICNKIGCNMKVVDEFDREVGALYHIEAFMNFRYNLYLTGTQYKSLKPDDAVFQLIFRKSHILGKDIKITPNKSLICIKTRFFPTPKEHIEISRSDDTFKIFYNNYLARKDVTLDYIMNSFYHKDNSLMKQILADEGTIVFYCGRINNCEKVKDSLINNHSIDPNQIGIINSSISNKREYEENKNKQFIITTTSSLGRGYDDKRLRMLIFLEFTFSRSELMQSISRVGRVGGKKGYVIYPVDYSFPKVTRSFESKLQFIFNESHFSKIHYFAIPEEKFKEYVYGYRPDSEEAKAINKRKSKKKISIELHRFL